MAVNLKGRSFLTLNDFTPLEIRYLLDLGHNLKAKRRAGICDPALQGKHIVLLFEKTSTRTRHPGGRSRHLSGRRQLPDGQERIPGGLCQGTGPLL